MVAFPMEVYDYIEFRKKEKPLLKKEAPEHIKEIVRKVNARIISLGGEKQYIIEGEDDVDAKAKFEAVDLFLKEMNQDGTSSVVCPICKTKLIFLGDATAYEVRCQTSNCLLETFRGI